MRKTEDVDTAPQVWQLQPPPAIERRKAETTVHGITLSDDFAWLRAANWQDVLRDPAALPDDIRRVIETENDYARAILAPAAELRKELVKEMRARIKEDDADVPSPDGPWLYYARHSQGGSIRFFAAPSARAAVSRKSSSTAMSKAAGRHFSRSARFTMRRTTPSWPGAPTRAGRSFIPSGFAASPQVPIIRSQRTAEKSSPTPTAVWCG